MRFGLVSDLHWMQEPPPAAAGWHGMGSDFAGVRERLDRALAHFAAAEVDRIVIAGDLSHHGDRESALALLRALEPASAPVLVVVGNHDLGDGDPDGLARAVAEAAIPGVSLARPEGEAVEWLRIAGVHVGASEGWFEASLAAFSAAAIRQPGPLLLVSHYPVLSLATEVAARGLPYPGDLLDRDAIASELTARSEPAIVLGGHLHVRATHTSGPVLQLSAGALVEPPYECAVVEVERDTEGVVSVSRSCQRLRDQHGAGEPILSPDRETWSFDGRLWIEDVADVSAPPRSPFPIHTEGA
jgi:predicted phosphodiesterase